MLCLRELLETNRLYDTITPVIEPVRCNSTFFSTIEKFIEADRNVIIIKNPGVGTFVSDYLKLEKKIEEEQSEEKKKKLQLTMQKYNEIYEDEHVINAYLCNDEVISMCLNNQIVTEKIVMINMGQDMFNYYAEYGQRLEARYTMIPKDVDFQEEVWGQTVVLEDGYMRAKRNVDYIDEPDQQFSRNHLVYRRRGYAGFSDYSIVGNTYEESGFAPLAVAIHIVYFGSKQELRVHHFVSESNKTFLDPARKFGEAMENLLDWENYSIIPKTYGLQTLIDYYENGKFPGLGVIKKCSVMHHLEVVGRYLEENR